MYRVLPLLLCLGIASSAPQTKPADSGVTFVKIQPVVEENAPAEVSKRRESRIENLPLTIPGNLNQDSDRGGPNSGPDDGLNSGQDSRQNISLNSSPNDPNIVQDSGLNREQIFDPNSGQVVGLNSDQVVGPNSDQGNLDDIKSNSEKPNDLLRAEDSINEDILPAVPNSARQGRNYDSYETTELFEIATERYDDITEAPTSKRPPKFGQTPKLSYFQKPYERTSTNLLEKSSKRRFRSRCRCEKIWNCPKLQISVPRCPNEYFLCCF